jgi:hypothetical protein
VPLAHRGEHARLAVVVVLVAALLGLDVGVDRVGDGLVCAARPADAIIVAPATYNTINKWAQGISDTYALGILAQTTALGVPIVVLPFVNSALAARAPFRRSIEELRREGVHILLGPACSRLPGAPLSRSRLPRLGRPTRRMRLVSLNLNASPVRKRSGYPEQDLRIQAGGVASNSHGTYEAVRSLSCYVMLALLALYQLRTGNIVNLVVLMAGVRNPSTGKDHDTSAADSFTTGVKVAELIGYPASKSPDCVASEAASRGPECHS